MTKAGMDNRELQLKIERYTDMLFKLSYIRLQNRQDAEDVVQEVFYQYLKNSTSFESQEHEKAWLLRVTLNACKKVWRSAWKRHQSDCCPKSSMQEGYGRLGDIAETGELNSGMALTAAVVEPEESAVRQEEKRLLLQAVMALPEKYRDVIHLFYYEELSVKEIARITNRGESTVTSQLTRGRELLRKSLKEEYDFG
ncbi:MAG: sigma-70 family RNA polymerase sigma factor [Lachnospiraceae bacterium]|nr:sigma-70 family RNA polymerase sigma factor [Lachnospiraceae bacterium]